MLTFEEALATTKTGAARRAKLRQYERFAGTDFIPSIRDRPIRKSSTKGGLKDHADDPIQVAMLRCVLDEEQEEIVDEAHFLHDQ